MENCFLSLYKLPAYYPQCFAAWPAKPKVLTILTYTASLPSSVIEWSQNSMLRIQRAYVLTKLQQQKPASQQQHLEHKTLSHLLPPFSPELPIRLGKLFSPFRSHDPFKTLLKITEIPREFLLCGLYLSIFYYIRN